LSPAAVPLVCIPIGVVVERRKADSPWIDFTCALFAEWKDPDAEAAYRSGRARFGFLSPHCAERWFDVEKARCHGFDVYEIPAERVWVSKSGRQVLFIPKEQKTND